MCGWVGVCATNKSRASMALIGLGPQKRVLAKGSSSHPELIMHKMTFKDHDNSSSQPR